MKRILIRADKSYLVRRKCKRGIQTCFYTRFSRARPSILDTSKASDLEIITFMARKYPDSTLIGLNEFESKIFEGYAFGDDVIDSAIAQLKTVFGKLEEYIAVGPVLEGVKTKIAFGQRFAATYSFYPWNPGCPGTITLEACSMASFPIEMCIDTLGHEIAHAIAIMAGGAPTHRDKKFVSLCKDMGVSPRHCVSGVPTANAIVRRWLMSQEKFKDSVKAEFPMKIDTE